MVVVEGEAAHDLEALARRPIQVTDQPFILPGGLTVRVGMSIGTATLNPGGDADSTLDLADRNMSLMKSRHNTTSSK